MTTVRCDLSGAKKRFSDIERAQLALTERVRTDSNVYCKVDTGSTRDSAVVLDPKTVAWTTRYATYAYYDSHALKGKNPQASSKWFETAKKRHMNDWRKVVKAFL